MGYSVIVSGDTSFPLDMKTCVGHIISDASELGTVSVTATAGAYNNLTVDSNAALRQNDIIQIPGAGTAGGNLAVIVSQIGNFSSQVDLTKICIRQQRPIITAVTNAVCSPYYKVFTRFRPESIVLTNLNTLDRYEWRREMLENQCIKTTANGVRTLSDSGIFPVAFGFFFHPSMLAPSQSMAFECTFR